MDPWRSAGGGGQAGAEGTCCGAAPAGGSTSATWPWVATSAATTRLSAPVGGGDDPARPHPRTARAACPAACSKPRPSSGRHGGSRWTRTLFTPAQFDALPRIPFPAAADTYPGRDDVAGIWVGRCMAGVPANAGWTLYPAGGCFPIRPTSSAAGRVSPPPERRQWAAARRTLASPRQTPVRHQEQAVAAGWGRGPLQSRPPARQQSERQQRRIEHRRGHPPHYVTHCDRYPRPGARTGWRPCGLTSESGQLGR